MSSFTLPQTATRSSRQDILAPYAVPTTPNFKLRSEQSSGAQAFTPLTPANKIVATRLGLHNAAFSMPHLGKLDFNSAASPNTEAKMKKSLVCHLLGGRVENLPRNLDRICPRILVPLIQTHSERQQRRTSKLLETTCEQQLDIVRWQ